MDRDIWQKALQAGLGLAERTKEKTHEIIEKLVQQGKLTSEEGQHILHEVKDATLKGSEEAKDKFQQGLASAREKLTFATSSDLEKLANKLAALEKKVKALEVTLLGLQKPAKAVPVKTKAKKKAKKTAKKAKAKSV